MKFEELTGFEQIKCMIDGSVPHASIADTIPMRLVEAGETCIECGGTLEVTKGIEVGNIFKLGTKYSDKMNATYTAENGEEKTFIMGCYGIGISRTASAAVERFHDKDGIKWPMSIAPFKVEIVPININDELQWNTANELYNKCIVENIEVVIDDRDERAGFKFKDSELIGFPIRITVGKTINDGLVEMKIRMTGEQFTVKTEEVLDKIKEIISLS